MARPRPDLDLGSPSERSAVIVRSALSARLERLRRASVGDAAGGLPAHLTLLFPFVPPERLSRSVRATLARVAASHQPFGYRLVGAATWPDTVYAAVDPVGPFAALQAALAAAFPAFPIYGQDAAFEFVPHVTIAAGAAVDDTRVLRDGGWATLPRAVPASAIEVIARPINGRWRTVWRIPLGRRTRSADRGIRSLELPP